MLLRKEDQDCTWHKGVLCIGSNDKQGESFELAHRMLKKLLPNIRFAELQVTIPVGLTNSTLFWNQIGVFETKHSAQQLRVQFKEIEKQAGRKPEDKEKEKICLDIDLLCYNHAVLKSEEVIRDYVKTSLNELGIEI